MKLSNFLNIAFACEAQHYIHRERFAPESLAESRSNASSQDVNSLCYTSPLIPLSENLIRNCFFTFAVTPSSYTPTDYHANVSEQRRRKFYPHEKSPRCCESGSAAWTDARADPSSRFGHSPRGAPKIGSSEIQASELFIFQTTECVTRVQELSLFQYPFLPMSDHTTAHPQLVFESKLLPSLITIHTMTQNWREK